MGRQAEQAAVGWVVSLLAMSDPAAHPALLAPDFATSFTSAATGHAFSSGGRESSVDVQRNSGLPVRPRPKGRFYPQIAQRLKV
jgi:hypothetical protein